MDETDGKLCLLLSDDPRASYRELADRLGISVQAVHRRIQLLRGQGIITGFTANISMRYLGAVRVDVVGQTQSDSIDEVVAALGKDDRVVTTLEASGHVLYVNGVLRDISELDDFVEFVRHAAEIPKPSVAIETGGPWVPRPANGRAEVRTLSDLDIRIIRALHTDARKSTTDVASELGVSAATVRRRLERMIKEEAIEFTADIDPTYAGDVSSIMGVTLEDGADRAKIAAHLLQKFRPRIVYFIQFGNLPDYLVCATWTKTVNDLHELVQRVQEQEGVRKVVANVPVAGYRFVSWRDKLLGSTGESQGGMHAFST